MVWIIWCLQLPFLLSSIVLIFFYSINLLFLSNSLPKNVIILSLSLSLSIIYYFLQLYFWLMNFYFFCISTLGWYIFSVCFLSSSSHVLSLSRLFIISCNSTFDWWIFIFFCISTLGWYIFSVCSYSFYLS